MAFLTLDQATDVTKLLAHMGNHSAESIGISSVLIEDSNGVEIGVISWNDEVEEFVWEQTR